jgi:hypothetical protein
LSVQRTGRNLVRELPDAIRSNRPSPSSSSRPAARGDDSAKRSGRASANASVGVHAGSIDTNMASGPCARAASLQVQAHTTFGRRDYSPARAAAMNVTKFAPDAPSGSAISSPTGCTKLPLGPSQIADKRPWPLTFELIANAQDAGTSKLAGTGGAHSGSTTPPTPPGSDAAPPPKSSQNENATSPSAAVGHLCFDPGLVLVDPTTNRKFEIPAEDICGEKPGPLPAQGATALLV